MSSILFKKIIIILAFETFICLENINLINYYQNINNYFQDNDNIPPSNDIEYYLNQITTLFGQILFQMSSNKSGNQTELNNIFNIMRNNKECLKFIEFVFGKEREFFNLLASTLLKEGIISDSIDLENDCLQEDKVYIFISGEFLYDSLKENLTKFSNEHLLFIESLSFHEEICLWKFCYDSYKPILEYIFKYYKDTTRIMFKIDNVKIEGINYYTNVTNKETLNPKKSNKNDNYSKCLKILFYIFLIIVFLFTIVSTYIEKHIEKKNEILSENDSLILNSSKRSSRNSSGTRSSKNSELEEGFLFLREKTFKDTFFYKFMQTFNIFRNFLLLNKIKEPLSNQNSLVELSLIRLLIIFLIMIGENSYIILKYVDKGISLLSLTKHWSFLLIKIGSISYEYYKVICGIIFGFKFINYYKKYDEFDFKRYVNFLFKFIPYLIIFLLLHFGFNYPIIKFLNYYIWSIRSNYLTKKMNECYCIKDATNIFFPISILFKYNNTNFNIGQYNGCFRPTLFTISEFFCYLLILIIVVLFHKIKSKVFELFFFIFNFLYLCSFYFITKEVRDLKDEYTISRLFGLSGSIALPHLFFPLYYIGFNIGIIYYYHLHEINTFTRISINENEYLPFEYCYKIAIFLGRIRGKIKNTILIICIILITFISSFFSFIVNNLDDRENQLIFEFKDKPFVKFMYVYESILSGLVFSIFIIIYLSSNPRSIFRIILSSNLFIFGHKIYFVLFNTFYSVLRFSHGLSIIEIYLSTLYLIRNTLTLFSIAIFIVIIISILFFFPIKWLYFFISKGLQYNEFI